LNIGRLVLDWLSLTLLAIIPTLGGCIPSSTLLLHLLHPLPHFGIILHHPSEGCGISLSALRSTLGAGLGSLLSSCTSWCSAL
jgi:hypothetical protein